MSLPSSETRQWWIYKIVNPIGRTYIGKTSSLKTRINTYKATSGGGCNQQPLLFNSLKKYGFDNHKVEVIDEFYSSGSVADDKEMFWIRSFMTNLNKWRDMNGMNLTDGGEGTLGARYKRGYSNFNRKHTEETKAMISAAQKANPPNFWLGKNLSAETKKKLSEAMKGRPSKLRGIKCSEERRLQNSKSHIGVPSKLKGVKQPPRKGYINTSKQPILLFCEKGNFIKEFSSKREACRSLGVGKTILNALLSGEFGGLLNGYKIKNK